MPNFLYLDLETYKFFQDPEIKALPRYQQLPALGFAVAVTYSEADGFLTWWSSSLETFWEYLNQPWEIVGWNIQDFDLEVICHAVADMYAERGETYDPWLGGGWNTIDLFDMIRRATGRWYKLDVVAQANGCGSKTADGQQAAEWLRSGDPDLMQRAAEYCKQDVDLVFSLHRKLLDGDLLFLPSRTGRGETEDLYWRIE